VAAISQNNCTLRSSHKVRCTGIGLQSIGQFAAAPHSSATLGKLFARVPLSPSSIIWQQRKQNCLGSMVLQLELVFGLRPRNQRSAPYYGLRGSGKTQNHHYPTIISNGHKGDDGSSQLTASWLLSCGSDRPAWNSWTPPHPFPLPAAETEACCGNSAVCFGCGWWAADSECAEGMAFPFYRPCVCEHRRHHSLRFNLNCMPFTTV